MPYRYNPFTGDFDRVDTTNVPPEVPLQFDTDSGSAVPSSNVITFSGGNGIGTSGSGSTVTISMESPYTGDFTFSGNVTTQSHFIVDPGSDTDTDIITVDVTGTPTFSWDETDNIFNITTGLRVEEDFIAGNPGDELSGININGVMYNSVAKVSDIGGSNAALFIIHRHSTTLSPLIVTAHSNSNTNSHGVVTNNMPLFQVYPTGWAGSSYQIGAVISVEVDGATINNSSMPGRIVFSTTPSGSIVPVEAMRISQDQTIDCQQQVTAPSFSCDSITINDLPVASTDGANKAYVDSVASGSTYQAACEAASTTNLNATYNNGAAGIGATLTNAGTLAAFSIDGYAASLNDRILIKDQTTEYENGIYTVTTVGDGATAWVLTRATNFDQPAEITLGAIVPVEFGSTQASTICLQSETVTTIGTDPINFIQYGNAPFTTVQYNVLVGDGSNSIANIAPSATSGIPLVSKGSSADPDFDTALVVGGGSGRTSATAYSIICGGTTSTGAHQSVSGVGTSGQILQSNGAGSLPIWADLNSPLSFNAQTGTATPSSNVITIQGSGGIETLAAGNTISIIGSGESLITVTSLDNTDSPYTVLSSDYYLSCNVSSGSLQIELPNSPTTGKVYIVKDNSGNAAAQNITVTTVGGVVTIDGGTSFVMNTNYEAANFVFTGSSWEVY